MSERQRRAPRTVLGLVPWAIVAGLGPGARAFAAPAHPCASGGHGAQGATEWVVAPFVVELVGPLQRVRFEHDTDGPGSMGLPPFVVELEVALAPGERRRICAPTLVADPRGVPFGGAPAPELVATVPPGAAAQVKVVAAAAPRDAADPSVRAARLVPPADDSPRRAPGLALACLAVALPVVLARGLLGGAARRLGAPGSAAIGGSAPGAGARRLGRVLCAVAVTLVVGASAVAIDARQGWLRDGGSADGWTTSLGAGRAVTLRAPRTVLRLAEDGHVVRIDAWTRAASLRAPSIDGDADAERGGAPSCTVTLDLSGVAARGAAPVRLGYIDDGGGGVWVLAAERGAWIVERGFSAGARLLLPEVNTWGACAGVWVRAANGAWGRRGPWELGAALPEVTANGAGSAPPGWLAAGLPQGVRVLVTRLAPGTWAGPTAAAGAALRVGHVGGTGTVSGPLDGSVEGEVWLRRTDL